MNILERIKEWFEGEPQEAPVHLPNTGQQEYNSQTAPVDVQAQVTEMRLQAIPVSVDGIVPTWQMPNKHVIVKQSPFATVGAQDLFDGDYKIKRITMWVNGITGGSTGVYVGTKEDLANAAQGGSIWGAELPIFFPVSIEGLNKGLSFCQTQASITANGALQISYIVERWAD